MPNSLNLPGKFRWCLKKEFQTWPLGYSTSCWPWLPSSHAVASISSCSPHRRWTRGQDLGLVDRCPPAPSPQHLAPRLAPRRLLSTGDLQSPPGPLSPGRAVWILELLCLYQGHEKWNTVPSRGEKLHLLGSGCGYWEANRTTLTFPMPPKDHATQEQVAKPRIIQPICLCRTDLMCLIICRLTSDTPHEDEPRMLISLPEKTTKVWLKADLGRGKNTSAVPKPNTICLPNWMGAFPLFLNMSVEPNSSLQKTAHKSLSKSSVLGWAAFIIGEGLTGFYSGTHFYFYQFVSKGASVFKTEWALVMVFQFSCFSKYIQTVFIEQAFKEINTIRQPLSPLTFITGIWDLTSFLASLRRLFSTHARFLLLSFQSQDFTSWQHGTGPSTSHPCNSLPTSPADISSPRFHFLSCSFPSFGGSQRECQWPGNRGHSNILIHFMCEP